MTGKSANASPVRGRDGIGLACAIHDALRISILFAMRCRVRFVYDCKLISEFVDFNVKSGSYQVVLVIFSISLRLISANQDTIM